MRFTLCVMPEIYVLSTKSRTVYQQKSTKRGHIFSSMIALNVNTQSSALLFLTIQTVLRDCIKSLFSAH